MAEGNEMLYDIAAVIGREAGQALAELLEKAKTDEDFDAIYDGFYGELAFELEDFVEVGSE